MESGSPPCSPQIPSLIFDLFFLALSQAISNNLPTPFSSILTNGSILKILLFTNRYNLEEEIFIKDNHHLDKLDFREKVVHVIKKNKENKIINVEVDNTNQLKKIIDLKINRILLDNFRPNFLRKALKIIPVSIETEASGNINPANILNYAKTGVGRISLGYITHSVKNFNFSIEF